LTEAIPTLWSQGVIAPWHLRPSQLDVFSLMLRSKRPHIECARQFGKTTSILDFVLEMLIRNPGWICRWCEPWKEQCHEIVIPAVDKLQREITSSNRFRWREKGSQYRHPNGSVLYLRGVNEDKGESSRGPHSHIIVADEFGSWRNARYVVDEVLKPQLETTNGWFIFASTPPEDLGHLYYIYADEAADEGRFIQKTIFDNESLSKERIEEIKKDCGGDQSAAWLRERLLHRIKNPEKVVVPEYDEKLNDIEDDVRRPQFFDAYVGGDSGADDNTVILFSYWDFANDCIVFEDELVLNSQTTKVIADRAKEKEKENWGTEECFCELQPNPVGPKICMKHGLQPASRVYDADKQILIDISTEHRYVVTLPEKSDRMAAIRYFRLQVQQGKVKVKKKCRVLRRQLKVGQWANEKHLDFARSEDMELKHLDAIAAAVYLVRSVNRNHNPYPLYGSDVNQYTHMIPDVGPTGIEEQNLDAAFSIFSGG
jgi:hypothetical protein